MRLAWVIALLLAGCAQDAVGVDGLPADLAPAPGPGPGLAGAVWSGRELLEADRQDGLAKLRFARGTLDLPLHVHEHSDRFIAVLSGAGRFWWSQQSFQRFDASDVQSVPVAAGDVLVFTRNLLHTFSAPDHELVLLSYHSPEISFDDPRQYTIPTLRWMPRLVQVT